MNSDLAIVWEAGVLLDPDMEALQAISGELAHTWERVQRFRTRTEMVVSVLDDVRRPTPDAKFWQAVREQNVMMTELVNLSFEYRKNAVEIRILRRDYNEEESNLSRELIGIDIERKEWSAAQMRRTAQARAREVQEWSVIKAALEPDLKYGTDDVDAHQLEAMLKRFEHEASLVTEHTPPADARNILGLHVTSKRVSGNGA